MRTRLLDSLTTAEISAYLERNDIIFLPLGTAEIHGAMPVGCEHVLPLALAVRIAEKADGLVLPSLVYFYPGATAIGEGTVTVSVTTGVAYLKEICRSLLRQGFRRQILLSTHGPAYLTATVVVREFFEETRCPVAYIDMERQLNLHHATPTWDDFNKLLWGAYYLLGRLEEIPREQTPAERVPYPEATTRLGQAGATFGHYYSDERQHGWWPAHPLTEAERLARAQEGAREIERVVDEMDPAAIVANLKGLDDFLTAEVFAKYGDRLS